jgi:hypothetical protein
VLSAGHPQQQHQPQHQQRRRAQQRHSGLHEPLLPAQ